MTLERLVGTTLQKDLESQRELPLNSVHNGETWAFLEQEAACTAVGGARDLISSMAFGMTPAFFAERE